MPDADLRCESFADDASALLDGELAPEREAEVRAHLSSCVACRDSLLGLEQVDEVLRALPAPAFSPGSLERLRARIEVQTGMPEPSAVGVAASPRRAPPVRRRWLRRPAAAAVLAAAAALALYLAVGGEPRPLPEPAPGPRLAGSDERPAEPVEVPIPEAPDPSIAHSPETPPAPGAPESIVEPETLVAAVTPEPAPAAPAAPLEQESVEELAVALELDTIEDLEVIANLDLLEALIALEEGAG